MKVDSTRNNTTQSSEAPHAKKTGKAGEAAAAKEGKETKSTSKESAVAANTEISSKGKEFAKAKSVASGAPDVREEKIAELRRRIAGGEYKVDANAVADRLVDDHLETSGLG